MLLSIQYTRNVCIQIYAYMIETNRKCALPIATQNESNQKRNQMQTDKFCKGDLITKHPIRMFDVCVFMSNSSIIQSEQTLHVSHLAAFHIKQMRNKLKLTKRNNESNKLAANANSTQIIFTATYLHVNDQTLL